MPETAMRVEVRRVGVGEFAQRVELTVGEMTMWRQECLMISIWEVAHVFVVSFRLVV